MTSRPAPKDPVTVPVGSVSGARAVAVAQAAGFVAVSSGPSPECVGEVDTVLEHPDGRRLLVVTTARGGCLVKAKAANRHAWPPGPYWAGSVPKVADLVRNPHST